MKQTTIRVYEETKNELERIKIEIYPIYGRILSNDEIIQILIEERELRSKKEEK
jgi:hypothetical protein